MDVLSTKDGSAQAVRDAAASEVIDSRMALERELDRLNVAVGGALDRVGAAPSVDAAGAGLPAGVLPDRPRRRLVAAAARQALAAHRHRRLRPRVTGPGTPVPAGQSRSHRAAAPESAAGRAGARAHRRAARRVLARRTHRAQRRRLGHHPDADRRPRRLGRAHAVHAGAALADRRQGRRGSARGNARRGRTGFHRADSAAPHPAQRESARKGEDAAPAPVAAETAAPEETGLAALFRRALNAPPAETTATAETVETVTAACRREVRPAVPSSACASP